MLFHMCLCCVYTRVSDIGVCVCVKELNQSNTFRVLIKTLVSPTTRLRPPLLLPPALTAA